MCIVHGVMLVAALVLVSDLTYVHVSYVRVRITVDHS